MKQVHNRNILQLQYSIELILQLSNSLFVVSNLITHHFVEVRRIWIQCHCQVVGNFISNSFNYQPISIFFSMKLTLRLIIIVHFCALFYDFYCLISLNCKKYLLKVVYQRTLQNRQSHWDISLLFLFPI